ncbi:hypothetical protein ACVIGB_000044 [Bradyrhizobium sp. USDA 4341]
MSNRNKRPQTSLPHDFFTHRDAWRSAIVAMRDAAPSRTEDMDERAYWDHELRAFDRAYADLAAARKKSAAESHPPQDLQQRLEAAFLKAGGIPGLAGSGGGASKVIEIALREFSAYMAGSSRQPTAWLCLNGQHDVTTDPKEVDQMIEAGSAVLPLFGSPETPSLVPEALENSNSLLAAMLLEKRADHEIEDQIAENRKALTTLRTPTEPAETPEGLAP